MTRHIMVVCLLALLAPLTTSISAQTPTVQSASAARPHTLATPQNTAQQIAALQQQVAELQLQINELEAKTKFLSTEGRSVTIHAPGTLFLLSDHLTSISGAQLTVTSQSTLAITGTIVQINKGGKPAARMGDAVAHGSVSAGSNTVMIGP